MTEDVDLHLPVLGDRLDDALPVGQVTQVMGERQLGQGLVAVGLASLPRRGPRPRDAVTRSRRAAASSGIDSATVTSRPRSAATSAMPEPMSPQPAMPRREMSGTADAVEVRSFGRWKPEADVGRIEPFSAEPK
ncbi:hypothetical protein AQJ46_44590 [Streptomyces canus]|uniref:Uncharacterized protein n=1 Tax=Streptomyces canus TaxID=58343 RepID=A0A101RM42_9ACTN|nr:hypothetical protein AQJ46_44590 [Streptomyces canus]